MDEGNIVLLNCFVYVYSKPTYNDVVAFRPSGNLNAQYSIKRVVGCPGDTIQIQGGYLYVNGERYKEATNVDAISDSGLAESEITLGTMNISSWEIIETTVRTVVMKRLKCYKRRNCW